MKGIYQDFIHTLIPNRWLGIKNLIAQSVIEEFINYRIMLSLSSFRII